MGRKSKNKGTAFEREICRTLSLWLTDDERTDVLWRSAMSGGRATRAQKRGEGARAVSGDIAAVADPGFAFTDAFYIECRNYRDLEYRRAFLNRGGLFLDFFKETCTEATAHRQVPLLITKDYATPILVSMNSASRNLFRVLRTAEPIAHLPAYDCYVYTLEYFILNEPPWRSHASLAHRSSLNRAARRRLS